MGGLLACQPGPSTQFGRTCVSSAPDPDVVIVHSVVCSEELIFSGEGGYGDVLIANSKFRAVMRHPQESLTVPGLNGGGLVDVAPWGFRDRLHEVIPLIGGGWLDLAEMTVEDNRVILSGVITSLPDRPADGAGEWAEVAWRVDPDDPWIHLEGADGLWINGAGDLDRLGPFLGDQRAIIAHNGVIEQDLGGALRVADADALLVAPSWSAWETLYPDGARAAGEAPNADTLEMLNGQEVIGRALILDGTFDTTVPPNTTGLRTLADGRMPSPVKPPDFSMLLEPGPTGTIALEVAWEATRVRPVSATWSDRLGRTGRMVLPPRGGLLPLGAGSYQLQISAGPTTSSREIAVEVSPGETATIGVSLDSTFDPGQRVLAAIGWPSDRSRSWRGSDEQSLLTAMGAGADYVVLTPEDEVADAELDVTQEASLRMRNGALSTHPDGWHIWSWPHNATLRRGGHGAPRIRTLNAEDALAVAWGGATTGRMLAVDLPWLAEAGDPWNVHPEPGFVRLPYPGPTGPSAGAWQEWYRWLDAGVDVVPLGPWTWVSVDDVQAVGEADVEAGLVRGRVVAGTGPVVDLRIGEAGPGDTAWWPPGFPQGLQPVVVDILGPTDSLDQLALIGEGGLLLHTQSIDALPVTVSLSMPNPGNWVFAVAWSEDADAWACTGPLWIRPPGG